ncbi:hypothetical protein GGR50DRAFT_139925 [Xylaria sp. CBS 124048]|nr:hypothetical protein GGR50DRAFT_139925 [Xylaria sp. CBS 124048]
MRPAIALVSVLFGLAFAAPWTAADKSTSIGKSPAGCAKSASGKFEISVTKVAEKKKIPKVRTPRAEVAGKKSKMTTRMQGTVSCDTDNGLVVTFKDGHIFDAKGRAGYIASNYQLQFDSPAQSGALVTSGFSLCEDSTLALGSSKTFYQCRSGSIFNLYDRTWASQCEPAFIVAIPCSSEDPTSTSQTQDETLTVEATAVPTTIVTQLTDGQPQVVPTTIVTQLADGQPQVVPTTITVSAFRTATFTFTPISFTTSSVTTTVTLPSVSESEIFSEVMVTTATHSSTLEEETSEATVSAETAPASSSDSSSTASESSSPEETPATTIDVGGSDATVSLSSPASTRTAAPPTSGSSRVVESSISALLVGIITAIL